MIAEVRRKRPNCVDRSECANVYFKGYSPENCTMASETVRIKPETHAKLKAISEATGRSMPEVLDQAVEVLRRQRCLMPRTKHSQHSSQIPRRGKQNKPNGLLGSPPLVMAWKGVRNDRRRTSARRSVECES